VDLPSFDMLRYMALRDFLGDPYYPMIMKQGLMNRIEVERPDLIEKIKGSEVEFMDRMKKKQEQMQEQNGS
jgi:hypothetical protein